MLQYWKHDVRNNDGVSTRRTGTSNSGIEAHTPLLHGGHCTFVVIRALDHDVCVQLLQLSVEELQLALGAAELRVHLLGIPFVGGGPAQILRPLLDLQLLADLPAYPLTVLVQALLHTAVREVRVLVQTELLEHRQPAGISLKEEKRMRVRWLTRRHTRRRG